MVIAYLLVVLGFPGGSAGTESACNVVDLGSIPGLERFPGEGNSYPLQYSGLENSTDCIVHGVAKSQTRLSYLHFTSLHLGFLLSRWAGSDVWTDLFLEHVKRTHGESKYVN